VVPQPGDNPALHHLHPHFDLGFVPGLGSAGRDDGDPIMVGEIGIRAIELGLIAMGAGDRGLEVVGDDDVGHPTEGGKGPHMGANPVRETLRPRGFDIGIVGGPQDGNKDLHLMHFPGTTVHDRDALAGIVDKELFPRTMALAHDQVELAGPGAIRLAEPTVLETLRRGGLIFLPQQEQSDALAFELVVHRGPVGDQGYGGTCGWGGRKQPLLQRSRIEPIGQGPG